MQTIRTMATVFTRMRKELIQRANSLPNVPRNTLGQMSISPQWFKVLREAENTERPYLS